jgi:hypothetical protein
LNLRRKSLSALALLRLALLALLGGVGLGACGDDEPAAPVPGGPGGGPASPYGAEGALLGAHPGAKQRPNLLIVACEQLRAGEASLPATDSVYVGGGGRAIVCNEAVTPMPEATAALASLVTGRLPSRPRVSHLDPVPRLDGGFVTLPEILRAQGYATRAFVGSERLRRGTSLWQGCDVDPSTMGLQEIRYSLATWITSLPKGTPWFALVVADEATPPYGGTQQVVPLGVENPDLESPSGAAENYLGNRSMYERVRERIRQEGGNDAVVAMERRLKRFLWEPRDPDPAFEPARLLERALEAYEKDVVWVDGLVNDVEIAARPKREEAIALYTATGGTAFGEHGILGAGRQLYDEQLRIPMVWFGIEPYRRLSDCVSLVDVLPTVLDVLGLPALSDVEGVSLLPVIRGQAHRPPVISEEHQDAENTGDPRVKATLVSVRSPKWKYIVRFDVRGGTVVEEAYDLTTDPPEKKNLANERGTVEGVPFDAEMCAAIERVRDGIWVEVQGVKAVEKSPYNMGTAVLTDRPRPCGK